MKLKRDPMTLAVMGICVLVIVLAGAYMLYNYVWMPLQIREQARRYAEMYDRVTLEPTAAASPSPTASAAIAASPGPSASATAESFDEIQDVALGTPGPDTVIYAAPTLPPVLSSFDGLLSINPETAGFLIMGNTQLPVVQRPYDNEFYLNHDFEGQESIAGCLFVDGVNRLYPRDKCLYIYGHNMKNDTMFGKLSDYKHARKVKEQPIVYFDTLYREGAYVPFACFALTADHDSADYFELRRFAFDQEGFADYVEQLKARSLLDIPVDVVYGDDLLVLVTCNYSIDDGRFVLALRRVRDWESEDEARELATQAQEK